MQKNFHEGDIHSTLSFIHENLEALKLVHKDLSRADLVCEESLLRLMKHADFCRKKYFMIRVRKSFGNILIDLSVPGKEFNFSGFIDIPDDSEFSPESQEAIQNLILRSFTSNISFKHLRDFNTITITALTSNYSGLYKVLSALILAIITGLTMRAFLPEDLCMTINNDIFRVVSAVFLNGLKMCAVPIVFFSIILCFADVGNLSGIKKAGTSGAKSILRACHDLNATFIGITKILVKFVPLVVFCSISSTIITMGFDIIASFLGILLTILLGHALMNIIYSLLIKFCAGLNPALIYKKCLSVIITAFSTCSSNAAIPDAMTAANKMGISQKFYPFAVSIGTSLNKEGGCIYLSVILLSVMNIYGFNISFPQIISLAVSIIILLSVSPSMPCAGIARLSVLFMQIGLPLDLMGALMALTSIEDMFETPANCMGNITAMTLAAKSENLIDLKEYNKP
ncbi:MAG: cation:dicarboxylase symporter family transporter [Synergistaceae bacterium]|nr:cation:dicarboxylase symporter family transporter [Synergistaceae bacterium]